MTILLITKRTMKLNLKCNLITDENRQSFRNMWLLQTIGNNTKACNANVMSRRLIGTVCNYYMVHCTMYIV